MSQRLTIEVDHPLDDVIDQVGSLLLLQVPTPDGGEVEQRLWIVNARQEGDNALIEAVGEPLP